METNNKLVKYLDKIMSYDIMSDNIHSPEISKTINIITIDMKILHAWKFFDYENEHIFRIDLELLLETLYRGIVITNLKSKIRLNQQEFRQGLLNKYNNACVISLNSNPDELEASHIIEIKDGGDYELSNGILLEANLHKTFDKYLWAINPNTAQIEFAKNKKCGSIEKYVGINLNNILDLDSNPFLYTNLLSRYNKFIEKNYGL